MDHQAELERSKYRNWVRGGLVYKYLKEGIEEFADEVVEQEHKRILQAVKHTSGLICTQCCFRSLKPLHKCDRDPATSKNRCPLLQAGCNCLYPKKQACPNNVCDAIIEEILKSHGSTPPSPNWRNTDLHKWCTSPWEIAKCFINAPGYSEKSGALDTDISGLLHVFIHNINLHCHLTCSIIGNDVFNKTLQRRNALFHSASMQLDDEDLNALIDDSISILEDEKELKAKSASQQAVRKLRQLKDEHFIITTHSEAEVCRAALSAINNKSEELKQLIQNAKDDINMKQTETSQAIEDKTQAAFEEIDNHNESLHVHERVKQLEADNSVIKRELKEMKQRLQEIEVKNTNLDAVRDRQETQLKYLNKKQVLQTKLVEIYQDHYVKTGVCPLKIEENDINIEEVYVSPEMVVEKQTFEKEAKIRKEKPRHTKYTSENSNVRPVYRYKELFETNGQKNRKIYIVGDAGSGKSSFCKMMIQDWCRSVTDQSNHTNAEIGKGSTENINAMKRFEFLFFIPLRKMSGIGSDITEMIKATCFNLAQNDVIDEIFQKESERCLIVADGLDEWSPPRNLPVSLEDVSWGIPNSYKANNAVVVTLSRPSARGILNMKTSECDQKVKLLGIHSRSVGSFIEKYRSKMKQSDFFLKEFLSKTEEIKDLEKSPMLLQQLLWMYCTGHEIGNSVSDTYSQILNIMLGWSQNKEEDGVIATGNVNVPKDFRHLKLPFLLRRFPRCETNNSFLYLLGKIAFQTLTSDTKPNTISETDLRKNGILRHDISTLIKSGILFEENCFDPTLEKTQLAFIHTSYLEFFAAVYTSSHCQEVNRPSPNKKRKRQKRVLEELLLENKSTADILQLSNLIKMICGLSPSTIRDISKLITDIVNTDEVMVTYRNENWQNGVPESEHVQIQDLIYSCSSECVSVSLSSVVIYYDTQISFLRRIIPNDVLSLYIVNNSNLEIWTWISQLNRLEYLYVSGIVMEHQQPTLLSICTQAVSLKYLTLNHIYCNNSSCTRHRIDLSKHEQLQRLRVHNYKSLNLFISDINTRRLEILRIDSLSTIDFNCLVNASNLAELNLGGNFSCFTTKYDTKMNSVVQTLHKLQKINLRNVHIGPEALAVVPEMNNLNHIELFEVSMSLTTWQIFVDSLLTLRQPVKVDTTRVLDYQLLDTAAYLAYIKQNDRLLRMISVSDEEFSFRSEPT